MGEVILSAERDVRLEPGAVVSRPSGPWTDSVTALLRHLARVGFTACPTVVASESKDGRHRVTFVEGEPACPRGWSNEGIWEVGRILRLLHEAAASFHPPGDAVWHDWYTHRPREDVLISHGDTGPWNVIARDGVPVAWIDWDFAGPVERLDEVAETARLHCQLHGEDVDAIHGLRSAEQRADQLRLFADAYGLDASERSVLVDRMVFCAVYGAANDTDEVGVTPSTVGPHPMVWGMAWQARGGRWILDNRDLLYRALGA